MTTTAKDAFVPICKTSDVRPGEGRHFRPMAGDFRNKAMAVFNEDGKFYTLNFICPHSGGPISEGTIKNGVVECPWHAWAFDAATGECTRHDGHTITAYETRVEGDDVLVGPVRRL